MDIGKNFTFITEDEAWLKKIGICAVCFIPPISLVGIFAFWGYVKKMFKNVQEGYERPLPEWDDFVGYLVEGLKTAVVILGYLLPAIIVNIVGTVLSIMGGAGGSSSLQMASMACSCIAFILFIVLGLFLNVGMMRFFATDSLGEAFNFGEILGFIKNNVGQYLLAVVIGIVAMICGYLGLIACIVGIFVTMPYMILVAWKNFADVYRNAQQPAVM